jgi:hypothetical protein
MKKFVLYGILGSVATMLLVASCKKDQPVTALNYGYNYFPNNIGHYVIYNVDSLVVNTLVAQPIDTFKYQIKELIDSIYPDNSGRPTQKIIRYKRADPTKPWVIEKVWSGNLTTTTAERDEDNIRYIRLIFPLNVNTTWNGNGYNTIPSDGSSYQYTSIDQPFTQGNQYFDSTLVVIQDSQQTGVSHKFYMDRYARNIGRITRKYIDLEDTGFVYQLLQPNLIITDTILKMLNSGSVVYTENYVSSGN